MTPSDLCKQGTEHGHQAALCAWTRLAKTQERYPFARRLFAIPNGGSRGQSQGAMFKAEGVRAGVPDLFLPVPCGQWPGLFIEMKKPGEERSKNGGLSDRQIELHEELKQVGYYVMTCYSWREAALTIAWYFGDSHLTIADIWES